MGEIYAKGEVCFERRRRLKREEENVAAGEEDTENGNKECLNLSPGLSGIMANSRNFELKKFVWQVGSRYEISGQLE